MFSKPVVEASVATIYSAADVPRGTPAVTLAGSVGNELRIGSNPGWLNINQRPRRMCQRPEGTAVTTWLIELVCFRFVGEAMRFLYKVFRVKSVGKVT